MHVLPLCLNVRFHFCLRHDLGLKRSVDKFSSYWWEQNGGKLIRCLHIKRRRSLNKSRCLCVNVCSWEVHLHSRKCEIKKSWKCWCCVFALSRSLLAWTSCTHEILKNCKWKICYCYYYLWNQMFQSNNIHVIGGPGNGHTNYRGIAVADGGPKATTWKTWDPKDCFKRYCGLDSVDIKLLEQEYWEVWLT